MIVADWVGWHLLTVNGLRLRTNRPSNLLLADPSTMFLEISSHPTKPSAAEETFSNDKKTILRRLSMISVVDDVTSDELFRMRNDYLASQGLP